jgi:hypothetical protein
MALEDKMNENMIAYEEQQLIKRALNAERPFRVLMIRARKEQNFDKKEISVKKAGKKINVYDMIQAGREDTEVYPTLEKYGSIEKMQLDTKGTYADLTEIGNLRNVIERANKAEELWQGLPLQVRQQFNHNPSLFMESGEQWIKKMIDEETAKQAKIAEIARTATSDIAKTVKE